MKRPTLFLFFVVVAFLYYFFAQSKYLILETDIAVSCMLYPDCNCIDLFNEKWSVFQKAFYQHLLYIDFIFIAFYALFLGFGSYLEMQRQRICLLNNLLRLNLLLLIIAILADVVENFFQLHYFSNFPVTCGGLSFIPTLLKWSTIGLILLFWGISFLYRKLKLTFQ